MTKEASHRYGEVLKCPLIRIGAALKWCQQADALIDLLRSICVFRKLPYNRLIGQVTQRVVVDDKIHYRVRSGLIAGAVFIDSH